MRQFQYISRKLNGVVLLLGVSATVKYIKCCKTTATTTNPPPIKIATEIYQTVL